MRFIPIALLLAACAPAPEDPGPPAAAVAPDCADLERSVEVDGPPRDDEEVPERNGAADRAGEVRAWAQQEAPDSFAGIWIDQEAGGVLTVAFANDVDRYRDQVHDRFGEEIVVVGADHPYAELERVADEIREDPDIPMGAEPGAVTGWGIRETINRVTIDLLSPDDALLAQLSERYGADRICFNIEPIPGEEDAQVALWAPAPDADLSPSAVEIDLLVNERACASGQDAEGRIAPPGVEYRDDAVVVTIRVIPKPGPQTCPSNPDTPYTLTLDEPLGDRELLDGGEDPPAPPALNS
jgi:hypothetical protein